jgi:hypothetical protein
MPFISKTCEGERCYCGDPAVRKVGEEIPYDDPNPNRHNLTAYICKRHYIELMGPAAIHQFEDTPIIELSDEWRDDRRRRFYNLSPELQIEVDSNRITLEEAEKR